MRMLVLSFWLAALSAVAATQVNPVPLVNQPLIPADVDPGHDAFALTVNGTGFVSGSTVDWNGTGRTTTFVSSTQLMAQINAADVANAGTASVTVVNPQPGGGASNIVFFPVRQSSSSAAFGAGGTFSDAETFGDFNNDGILDVVVGTRNRDGSGDIEIYLGKGDGTFTGPVTTKSVTRVEQLVAGDFNRDGKLDLAVADSMGNVSIFLNQGGGKMKQVQVFDSFYVLATADFNADGNLDLYVVSRAGAGGVCLGRGDGTFEKPLESGTSGMLAIGDFNGDGILDLAFADIDLYIYLGNGDGTFTFSRNYQTGYGGEGVATADFNGDGILDVITAGGAVLLGKGDGTFTTDGGTDVGGNGVMLGDFNGDGKLDAVIITNGQQQQINLLLGNGDGTFQYPVQFPASGSLIGVADFNGDGGLDVLTSSGLFLQISASLKPSQLDFGSRNVGSKSKPKAATLTNLGSSDLVIQQIGINGNDPSDFAQTNNCPSSLPPNKKCQLKVTFDPTQTGTRSASLYVNYQGVGSPQTVALSGTGVDLTVTLNPSSMKFGVQQVNTRSAPQLATLTNHGSQPVTISSISADSPFSQNNNCPSTLEPNSSCHIHVIFTPTDRGAAHGRLVVRDNAQGSPQTAALSGTGTVVKLKPDSVNFGNQKVGTQSSPHAVKLMNIASTSLSISKITLAGAEAGDFSQTNDCGNGVPPESSCTIEVTFAPAAKGKRTADVEVYDDGGGSPQKVALAGTGT